MASLYRIDDYQQTYFVIDNFEDLLRQTVETDLGPLCEPLGHEPDLPIDAFLPSDRQVVGLRRQIQVTNLTGAIVPAQQPCVGPVQVG